MFYLVCTTRLWNNIHPVMLKVKRLESQAIKESLGARVYTGGKIVKGYIMPEGD